MPTCPICSTEHQTLVNQATRERILTPCVQALKARVDELEEKAHAAILKTATTLEALAGRVARMEAPTVRGEAFEEAVSATPPPLPEPVRAISSEELHAAVDAHIDAGGTVVFEQPVAEPAAAILDPPPTAKA